MSKKNNLSKMMGLDVFLSAVKPKNKNIANFETSKPKIMPLLSWDIYSSYFFNINNQFKKEKDIREIVDLAEKFEWTTDLKVLLATEDFDALVVTDHHKKIMWVNDGFSDMTGYPKKYAIHKTPSFLQGKDTSEETKERIRQKIAAHLPFTDVIINYKKDNTPYKCQIKIIPLYGKDAIHYLAIEKEVA